MAKFEIGDVVIIRKPDSVETRKESPVWVDNIDTIHSPKTILQNNEELLLLV